MAYYYSKAAYEDKNIYVLDIIPGHWNSHKLLVYRRLFNYQCVHAHNEFPPDRTATNIKYHKGER